MRRRLLAIAEPEQAADDQADRDSPIRTEAISLAAPRAVRLSVILFHRFEPGQGGRRRRSSWVVGADIGHHCISSAAATPMMPRPLRIICPIAEASSRRARVNSGSLYQ